jgi:phosphoribosylglycinamide formyltransferase-1
MQLFREGNKMDMAVLASGYGSNLQAIIDAVERGEIKGRIKTVISDVKDAYALERARRHNIEAIYINPRDYPGRKAFNEAIAALLEEKGIDLVVLAGYMRLVSPVIIDKYSEYTSFTATCFSRAGRCQTGPGLRGKSERLYGSFC